jgi:putative oxidoreductase
VVASRPGPIGEAGVGAGMTLPGAGRVLALLRMMTALLFIEHGLQLYFDFPSPPPFALTQIFSVAGLAGALDLVGGAMILVGLMTRPVAFVLSGMMAAAYFMAHAPSGFFPIVNGGEPAILYCFIFLLLAAAGSGAWSVDLWLAGRPARRPEPASGDG